MTTMKSPKTILRLLALALFIFMQSKADAQLFNKSYMLPGYGLRLGATKLLLDGNILLAGIKSTSLQDKFIYATKLNPATGDTIWSKTYSTNNHYYSNVALEELTNGDLILAANVKDSFAIADSPKLLILSLNSTGGRELE
jgi:hypothetical protein